MLQPKELVMGKPQKKYDPKHNQDQDQDQKQDQLQAQANLQAQLQGQGQAQGQGQGQLQFAVQSLDSKSENDNKNDNKNENDNKNSNEVDNKLDNKVDNSLDNKVDNSLDNKVDNNIDNKIENTVDNKVNVAVNVDVDLDLKADGLSSPVIDLNHFQTYGSVVMPDVVDQKMGDGNQFNIDQVNNLVDNDVNWSSATYNGGNGGSWCEPGASFSMDAKIDGGTSRIDAGDFGDRANVASHADAVLNQSAFDQNITQGANIQFNSISIQAAGDNLTDNDIA
jgi:hypothetical protein